MFSKFFSGRLNRRTYFAGNLALRALSFALAIRLVGQTNLWVYLSLLFVLINFFGLSLTWRRLQDIGFRRRYIILIIFISFVFGLFLSNLLLFGLPLSIRFFSYIFDIYLIFTPGSPKANQYGPVPRDQVEWDKLLGEFSPADKN